MPRLTDSQLAARKGGLGASEIAALCDLDEHNSAFDVWAAKCLDLPRVEGVFQQSGHAIEPYIARLYEESFDAELVEVDTLVHREHPWAFASLDRRAVRGPVPYVEIKNVGAFATAGWGPPPSTVPASKLIQVQWQLEVADAEVEDIAALLGGTNFRRYTIVRDREFAAMLLEVAERFWRDHVLARIPPPHSASDAQRYAASRYPANDGTVLPTTKDAFELVKKLKRAKTAEKRIAAVVDGLEARAKEMIGAADAVDGCFRWKLDARGRVAWEKVAAELGATKEIIEKHTGAPARRFTLIERRRRNEDGGADQ